MSWSNLDEELRHFLPPSADLREIPQITNHIFVKRLIETKNTAALTEMCFQDGRPLTIIAGFLGMKMIEPHGSCSLALKIGWNEETMGDTDVLFRFVYIDLTNSNNTEEMSDALSYIMQIRPKSICAKMVMASINRKILLKWLTDGDLQNCLPSNVIRLVDFCWRDESSQKVISERLKKLLLHYSEIPGEAQLAYLKFYSPIDATFENVLKNVLQDNSVSDNDLKPIISLHINLVQKILSKKQSEFSSRRIKHLDKLTNSIMQGK